MKRVRFQQLEDLARKTLKAHYLVDFIDAVEENLAIDPNDKLTDRSELLDEFKSMASYREVADEFGFKEFKWVVSDNLKEALEEEAKRYPMKDLLDLKGEVLDAIIFNTKETLSQDPTATLLDTNVFEQLIKLDKIFYGERYDNFESFSEFSLKKAELLTLIKEPYEFSKIKEKLNNTDKFNYFNIFTYPKTQLEILVSHNELYENLTPKLQDHFVENYFIVGEIMKGVNPQLSSLYLWASKNPNPSTLGNNIVLHKDFYTLDTKRDIGNHDFFYYHKGTVENLLEFVSKGPETDELNEKLLVLTKLIDVGILDSSTQKHQFDDQIMNFYEITKNSNSADKETIEFIEKTINNSIEQREKALQKEIHYESKRLIDHPLSFKDYIESNAIKQHIERLAKMNDMQVVSLMNNLRNKPNSEYGKYLSTVIDKNFIQELERNAKPNFPVHHGKELLEIIQKQSIENDVKHTTTKKFKL